MSSLMDKDKMLNLPERQTKIASLIKNRDPVNCICRSNKSGTFLVNCELCDEWFHGNCVGIDEDMATQLQSYFCDSCRQTDPALEVQFKNERNKIKKLQKKDSFEPKAKKLKAGSSKDLIGCEDALEDLYPPQQCHGLDCTRISRKNSKYCSERCALTLALIRITNILPYRIQQWNLTPCVATEKDKKRLIDIDKELLKIKNVLKELDKKEKALNKIVAAGKCLKVEELKNVEDESGGETTIYCVTCGLEISSKNAVKHMNKCFIKHENQMSFDSLSKTTIAGLNIFCDFYNPSTKRYCKRLKVSCPEHLKSHKPNPAEACGCPLWNNLFKTSGELCKESKIKCNKHLNWERISRAEIDLERVRQWIKLDVLSTKKMETRQSLANRGNVIGLLLHSTYNHEIMDK